MYLVVGVKGVVRNGRLDRRQICRDGSGEERTPFRVKLESRFAHALNLKNARIRSLPETTHFDEHGIVRGVAAASSHCRDGAVGRRHAERLPPDSGGGQFAFRRTVGEHEYLVAGKLYRARRGNFPFKGARVLRRAYADGVLRAALLLALKEFGGLFPRITGGHRWRRVENHGERARRTTPCERRERGAHERQEREEFKPETRRRAKAVATTRGGKRCGRLGPKEQRSHRLRRTTAAEAVHRCQHGGGGESCGGERGCEDHRRPSTIPAAASSRTTSARGDSAARSMNAALKRRAAARQRTVCASSALR